MNFHERAEDQRTAGRGPRGYSESNRHDRKTLGHAGELKVRCSRCAGSGVAGIAMLGWICALAWIAWRLVDWLLFWNRNAAGSPRHQIRRAQFAGIVLHLTVVGGSETGSARRNLKRIEELQPRDWSGQLDSNQRPAVPKTYQLVPHLPSGTIRVLSLRGKPAQAITYRYPTPAVIGTAVLPPCFPEGK